MPLPALVLHAHTRVIDHGDLRIHMQLRVLPPGFAQQRKQRAALHAHTHQPRIQIAVLHVHYRAPARRVAIQTAHRRTMRKRLRQQAHVPEHLQPTGLQQKTGTHRPGRSCALEYLQLMPVGAQQHGQCLPRRSVTHYRNT